MIKALLALFQDKDRFVITTHQRPDGDALGSQLALGLLLMKMGKHVSLINCDPPPDNLDWLPKIGSVNVFEGSLGQLQAVADAEVIVVVDTNTASRIGKMATSVMDSAAIKVLIDHHTEPETWFDYDYRRESASSTGELIFDFIEALDLSLIDTEIATVLYTAIMTDTGSFRYSSVNARVHRIVAELLDRGGIEPAPIHVALYDTRTVEGLRLLSRCLNTLTLHFEGQLGYMVVQSHTLRETGAHVSETEGFVNYVLSIEGVRVGMLFTETAKGTKVSFRSKGDTYVHEWAQHFGGGGHRNASGAFLPSSLKPTIKKVIKAAPRFIEFGDEENLNDHAVSGDDAAYLSTLLEMQSKKTAS